MSPNSEPCAHCGGAIAVRNPTGKCDHLYYPEYCAVCKKAQREKQRIARHNAAVKEIVRGLHE